MFTAKCKHCGADFHPTSPKAKCCSPRCQFFANIIASFAKEKPATYDDIPHYCNMAMLIHQQGDPTW